jgi:hypothetical protein
VARTRTRCCSAWQRSRSGAAVVAPRWARTGSGRLQEPFLHESVPAPFLQSSTGAPVSRCSMDHSSFLSRSPLSSSSKNTLRHPSTEHQHGLFTGSSHLIRSALHAIAHNLQSKIFRSKQKTFQGRKKSPPQDLCPFQTSLQTLSKATPGPPPLFYVRRRPDISTAILIFSRTIFPSLVPHRPERRPPCPSTSLRR